MNYQEIVGGVAQRVPCTSEKSNYRSATFADPKMFTDDVVPVPHPTQLGVTTSSRPGVTYQVRPNYQSNCDPTLPQTPFSSGMIVTLLDGSARAIRPTITPEVFWSAVTPNKGEVLGDW
jgi:hypothetical protein